MYALKKVALSWRWRRRRATHNDALESRGFDLDFVF